MKKSTKGQSLTEFVIVMPALLLVIAGGIQLLMICRAKISLVKIEHAVIRAAASGEDINTLERLTAECAEIYGIESDKVGLYDQKGRRLTQGAFSFAAGADIMIAYDYPVPVIFSKIFGKNKIRLKTFIHVPAGGSFNNPDKKIMDILWKSFPGF